MATETEIVRHRDLKRRVGHILDVRHVIEVAIRVGRLVIDRRWHHLLLEHLTADSRLDATSCSKEMANRTFRRRDLDLRRVIFKRNLVREGLEFVIERSRCPVGVDVPNLGRRTAGRATAR